MNNYIYKVENISTKQFYIGVRSCKAEICDDKYMGSSSIWDKTYIKQNKEILVKHIIEVLDSRSLANKKEVEYLKSFQNDPLCVNILFDIIPSHLGRKQTPEHIEKRKLFGERNGRYTKEVTEETRQKMSKTLKGKKKPEGFATKCSEIQTGKITSQETKDKLSVVHKEKYKNGYRQPTSKPVIVEDLQENTITEYPSNTDFCLVYGYDKQSVGVFIRKGLLYKKRFKIAYKSK